MQMQSAINDSKVRIPEQQGRKAKQSTEVSYDNRVAVTGASGVHRALCAPELQRIGEYELASQVLPAKHVGGDFVCSFQQGNQTFAVLGDLMGKGLSAAMWITHIIDLVHRSAEPSQNVCDLLGRLNLEIVNSRVRAPLASAVAICLDHVSDEVSVACAGHPSAVLVRRDAKTETIAEGGPVLGVFPHARYTCKTVQLGPGDAIAAFSDGITESHNSANEEFSVMRAIRLLSGAASAGAKQKITKLVGAASAFRAETECVDDISMLVLQRVETPAAEVMAALKQGFAF